MSQVREIKCPQCGKWTLWEGDINDRCLYCNSFLESHSFSRGIEKKAREEAMRESGFLYIRPGDGPVKRALKRSISAFRWLGIYLQVAFFIVVTIIIVLISLIPG
ncbi:MAG: hypothetical protein M3O71_01535 [Bacteroidota bacterium]|nr:hypothetical protein [Bacteroidota bacterium]